jgi:hypothetical protein
MSDSWFYVRDGQPVGPLSRAQLLQELRASPFWQQERVWKEGYGAWLEAGSVDELSFEVAQSQLEHLAKHKHGSARESSSVLRTMLVYAGLAVFGVLSAVVYHFLF